MLGLFKKSQGDEAEAVISNDRKDVPFEKITVRSFDKETGVFFSTDDKEAYLGVCYVGEPLKGADSATVDKLRSALGVPLPAGSFIQIGLLSSPLVSHYTDRFMDKKRDTISRVLSELSTRHHDYIVGGTEAPLVQRSNVLLCSQQLIFTIKVPLRSANPRMDELREVREMADKVSEGLAAAGMRLDRVEAEGYVFLSRMLADPWTYPSSHYDEDAPLREQVYFSGDNINFEDETTISFGNDQHFAKAMSVKYFPRRASLAIMNYMIGDPMGLSNQVTDPYYMVATIHYPDQVKKADWVRNRSSMINHQVFGPTAHLIPALGYKKAGIDTLVHEMEGRGAVLCEVNLTLMLFSRDKQRLNKLAAGLQAYYASLAFELREDRRILEPLWNLVQPLNTTRRGTQNLYRFHTMAVAHAVQFLPVIGEWRGSGTSGTTMLLTRRGQPALFDLYESPTNYNGVVFAESGGGKSFFTQRLVCDYLAEGAKVWTIDAGKSYYKLCKAVEGEFIQFTPESQLCLNPFTHIDGNLDEEMDILKAIIAKMAAPEEVLDDYRMSILEQAITSVYKHYGNAATVTAVAEWCLSQTDVEAQRLGKQLYPFAGGAYTRWFDGDNNLNLDNSFVVLELQDLKGRKALQQVVLLQLISRINHDIFLTHGRKKILIIDEGWELVNDPVMGKAMEAAYRKARKHDAAVIFITQSISDLYNSPNARAIAENSAWQFILQQKAESVDAAIDGGQFKIEPYGAMQLKTVHTLRGKYSEVMVKRTENDWGILRLVVDRFTQVMFSTSGTERDDILSAIDRGEDVVDAINHYVEVNG